MSPTLEEKAAWLANSDRNLFGFTKVPIIGLVALVSLIVLSGVSMFLPPLLFASPLIAIAIPAIFSAITCAALVAGGIYMYVNRNKQTDDRYRLEFERIQIEPNLYFDEDQEYINDLFTKYDQATGKGQDPDKEQPLWNYEWGFKPGVSTVYEEEEQQNQFELNP